MAETEFLFREDAYLREAEATIAGVTENSGIALDRTVFYAASGGQPGDSGTITRADGSIIAIVNAIHPGDKSQIIHIPENGQVSPEPGEKVELAIDWERRYRLMRMHTALHMLSVIFPFPVTGGSIGEEKSRLDFNMPQVPEDKVALERKLNALVAGDHVVEAEWITDEEMAAQPALTKTMKVKPPVGLGRVRLIRVGAGTGTIDLQPCGGTHVGTTGEIGALRIGKIEKKGRENRRVNLFFA